MTASWLKRLLKLSTTRLVLIRINVAQYSTFVAVLVHIMRDVPILIPSILDVFIGHFARPKLPDHFEHCSVAEPLQPTCYVHINYIPSIRADELIRYRHVSWLTLATICVVLGEHFQHGTCEARPALVSSHTKMDGTLE